MAAPMMVTPAVNNSLNIAAGHSNNTMSSAENNSPRRAVGRNKNYSLNQLKETLILATLNSIPGYDPNKKPKKSSSVTVRTPEVTAASRESKKAWWKWKENGSSVNPQNPLWCNMKDQKRKLRQVLRRHAAAKTQKAIDEIMLSKDNSKTFYKLIRAQRTTVKPNANCLNVNGELLTTDEEMTEGWADHFERLATPADNPNYDNEFLSKVHEDIKKIEDYEPLTEYIKPTSRDEIKHAIKQLNNNKAADCFGLQAEHFKYGGETICEILSVLINAIFYTKKIPDPLKLGTITPIYKKGDNKLPDNYRGITVTPILLKIIEHILNQRHKNIMYPTQSRLQTGFTKGTSSTRSALIVSECRLEAKAEKENLFFITLDTKKAFDVVNHDILLRNLLFDDVPIPEWRLLKDTYTKMSACVKWRSHNSRSISINQGVRQGGVLSTEHYKRYNNPLLTKLENNFEGAKIGNIKIPHTTCADDVALLSHSTSEMELMLTTVGNFTTTHRYDINSTKSACLMFKNKKCDEEPKFLLNNEPIPLTDSTTHLGITRETGKSTIVESRIQLGRRTAYSLLGAGFHGVNGLTQKTKSHIWNTYVVPRVLYGLEVITFTQKEVKKLDAFQTKCIKQLQHLPDRTSNTASSALMGIIPLEVQIHKNILNLFYGILQSTKSVEYEIAVRQLATKTLDDNSFFSYVRRLLLLYKLPSAYSLLENTPGKQIWKKMLTENVNSRVEMLWKEDIASKSSLKYLNPDSLKVGQVHHVYSTVRPNKEDVKRSELKARILLGSYPLQSNKAVFNQYTVDPTCRLCQHEAETRDHFITKCTALQYIRSKYSKLIQSALEDRIPDLQLSSVDSIFTQLILDYTNQDTIDTKQLSTSNINRLEHLSREYLWKIHLSRSQKLAKCQ